MDGVVDDRIGQPGNSSPHDPTHQSSDLARFRFPLIRFGTTCYDRYGDRLGLLAALLMPLKLSITYAPLISALLLFLSKCLAGHLNTEQWRAQRGLVGFYLFALAVSLTGLNPVASTNRLLSLLFFSLTVFLYADLCRHRGFTRYAWALLTGQTIAALHSVADATLGNTLGQWFLGAVTESGQLAITIFVALALLYTFRRSDPKPLLLGWGTVQLVLLLLVGFSPQIPLSPLGLALAVGSSAICLLATALKWRKATQSGNNKSGFILATIILPLLFAALLLNLKRGPWTGVAAGLIYIGVMHSRWLLIPTVAGVIGALTFFSPLLNRLLQSLSHFTIAGGRQAIWEIGIELTTHYPLGIGFGNSRILRQFSSEIPPELTHFHNNLLNVAVEVGWLGVLIYVTWLYAVLRLPFLMRKSPAFAYLLTLSTGILAWQVAGLVEYNFGDSEVLLLAFMVLGWLTAECVRHSESCSGKLPTHPQAKCTTTLAKEVQPQSGPVD